MYYSTDFDSVISIERQRIDNFYAYIYVKIVSPKAHDEHKSYRMWIEDCETGVTELLDKNIYYIDKNEASNGINFDYDFNVEIERSKEICFKLYLSNQHVDKNRFYKRFRLHFKKNQYCTNADESVWISDELIMASREFRMPDIICKNLSKIEGGRLRAKIKAVFATSKDEVDYNSFLKMSAIFYHKERIVGEEEVEALSKDTTWQNYYFETQNKYGDEITKIKIINKFFNGLVASSKEFQLETIDQQKFFIAREENIERSIATRIGDDNCMPKKIQTIYIKP